MNTERIESLSQPRFDRVDAFRGLAIVWMAAFHFSFDLSHFNFIHQNFYDDPLWTRQRIVIVSMFLFCAGIGQALAYEQRQPWPRFWRRWLQIAGCAVLVSAGSWLMFPASFISFGVLHGLALMLIIARLTARAINWLWLWGLIAVALPHGVHDSFFDARSTNWIGLITHRPVTEDYVPVLPWLGVVWWGVATGRWLWATHRPWLAGDIPKGLMPLAVLGRWSLSFYMLHQPIFIGALLLVMAWRG